ncbi:optic atrophy 3 protein homolog [Panonychus citri]|uniref:optic atrophy 3 protein homolog n=1 Tax=Panonychus citri TaxID=50023 RepID=UPI002307EBF7|nr:optic atrophy 3 protein homolog [Panonychus citri]
MSSSFPLVKLISLAVRQMSKPLANRIKEKAKSSLFFRTYICMPPAQTYHWIEVNVKMKLLNLGKPNQVTKLNENSAIELGAELLGESIIFCIAVITVTLEFMRQARKANNEAVKTEERWSSTEEKMSQVEEQIKRLNNI